MMLLLDIGNSAVKGAFSEGETLLDPFRIPVKPGTDPDELESSLRGVVGTAPIDAAGIVSVVPSLSPVVVEALRRLTGLEAVLIDHRTALPFSLAYETPQTLGADRLAAAAAAHLRYGRRGDGSPRGVVALDAGTAVTCEVVDRDAVYRGGSIAAGPEVHRDALGSGTAQLPRVALDLPEHPIGRSTREALQVGILYGFVDAVAGMLSRIAGELGEQPYVVATGGWGDFLFRHVDAIDEVEPHLVLHGIRLLMDLRIGVPGTGH